MKTEQRLRVLVTGGGGFIGSHVVRLAPGFAPGAEVLAPLRRQLDLLDSHAVEAWFREHKPDVVIHCAALSRAVACDENPQLARLLNVDLVRQLVDMAADCRFVHLSTDLVFDGSKGRYNESDAIGPLNIYAETKAAAEKIVATHPRHLLLRTSLNYGASSSSHRSFNEDIIENWRLGRARTFFTDEYRSPIPVEATVRAIWELVFQGVLGLYHLGGSQRLSRWDLASLLLNQHPEFRHLAQSGSLKDYRGPRRAADTSLDSSKVQTHLSFPLPGLAEWLERRSAAVHT